MLRLDARSTTPHPWPSQRYSAIAEVTDERRVMTTQYFFTDNFSSPSPLWSNLVGNWTGSGGIYFAQAPSNNPLTYSGLPF